MLYSYLLITRSVCNQLLFDSNLFMQIQIECYKFTERRVMFAFRGTVSYDLSQ